MLHILSLQVHIANFGSQSSPSGYAQQSSSPPPSLQTVDPVQAEQVASRLADAFRHAFVGDNMDEDENGAGDEGNEDREEDEGDEDEDEDEMDTDEMDTDEMDTDEMDTDDPVRAARMSAKAWVCNRHPCGYSHSLHMQV